MNACIPEVSEVVALQRQAANHEGCGASRPARRRIRGLPECAPRIMEAEPIQPHAEEGGGDARVPARSQMAVALVWENPWALSIGGMIVGLATNWLALKWIFEPVYPTKIGPFMVQGMFLKRQK